VVCESKRSLYARLICCAEYIADICIRAAVQVLVIDIQEMIAQGYVTDQMIVVGRRAQENTIKVLLLVRLPASVFPVLPVLPDPPSVIPA